MEPESILERVRLKYLELDSYRDEGTVSTDRATGGEAYTSRTEFKTYFARPDNVRFEWQRSKDDPFGKSDVDKNVIWSDGSYTRGIFLGRPRKHKSLSMAVAGATGVSSGAVNNILHLLMPNGIQLQWFWRNMTDARLVDVTKVRGFQCHHIIGSTRNGEDAEAWIGTDDYLVHRLGKKLVITPERRAESHKFAIETAKKRGLPQEQIAMMQQVYASSSSPDVRTPCFEFDYEKVSINEDLPDDLFRSGPTLRTE